MNRGVLQLQSSPPIMNPNWPWNINGEIRSPQPPLSPLLAPNSSFLFGQYYAPTSTPQLSFPPNSWSNLNPEFLESMSLSQLMIMGGLVGEGGEKSEMNSFQVNKLRLENWEEQVLLQNSPNTSSSIVDVKQEDSGSSSYPYGHHANNNSTNTDHYQGSCSAKSTSNWTTPPMVSASSPKSCVTSLSNGVLDFSSKKADGRKPPPDRSPEGNSNAAIGGGAKKAKVQPSSGSQSTFKVRKEKLGDRISSLHQLVSPFGKTDTASVLLEAIGYIRFLHNQIEVLSLPYLGNASGNMRHPPQHVQGERNCIFPEDPGQLLNGNCVKRKGAFELDPVEEQRRDLRSRGLCLVPVSCTLQVGSDNGADYWASAFGGGFQ